MHIDPDHADSCGKFIYTQLLTGLRQKIPIKYPQMYIPKDFDIVLIGLLVYLDYRRFWAYGVFPLSGKSLRLISQKCLISANLFSIAVEYKYPRHLKQMMINSRSYLQVSIVGFC